MNISFPRHSHKGRNSLRGTTLLPACFWRTLDRRNVPFPVSRYSCSGLLDPPHISMFRLSRNFSPCTGILNAFFAPPYHFPGNRSGVKLKLCQDPKRLSADGLFSLPGITGSFAPSQRFKLSYILVIFLWAVKYFYKNVCYMYTISKFSVSGMPAKMEMISSFV